MGGTSLKRRLSDLVKSLQAEENVQLPVEEPEIKRFRGFSDNGILDQQFDLLKDCHGEDSHQFLMSVLESFSKKTDDDLRDLAKYLSDEPIDYGTITIVAHRIKGCSSCIGACRIANVCNDLRDCSDENNKQGCYEAYERLITEYYSFCEKINKVRELLKSILQSEARKRR